MLLADFAPQVCWIVAQPFLVEAVLPGQPRRHVPDIALIDRAGAITIVNVKPPDRIGDPKVAVTFAWAGHVFEARGWQHEVWTGAPEGLLGNVRFLAGYRRRDRFDAQLLDAVMAMADEGRSRPPLPWDRGGGSGATGAAALAVVGPVADRPEHRPVRPLRIGACRMTTWTTTMAVGTRIGHQRRGPHRDCHRGLVGDIPFPRGRAWVADARQVLADPSTVVGAGPDVETAPDGVGELSANLTDRETTSSPSGWPICARW